MKRYKAQEKLVEILSKVKYHEAVLDEIKELVLAKGIAEQFIRSFAKNVTLIEELGRDVTKTNNFEKLSGADGLYSMKFKGRNMNLRMLYSYDILSNTIFLHLFYERDDSGKESYNQHIPIAKKRMEEREES